MKEKLTFYLCACGGEAIAIAEPDLLDGSIGLSMWRRGSYSLPWKYRLQHMWYILKYGHPYVEDILLHPDDAHSFIEKLLDFADIIQNEEQVK